MTEEAEAGSLTQPFAIVALVLILARAIAELWLSRLNQHHVRAHANELPPAFRGIIDEATYRRSADYTLAKSRFADITGVFDVVVLIAVLFSGVLPWAFERFTASFGTSIWAMAGFLFFLGIALSMLALPLAWYAQFKLEERFGFNTTTIKTWVLDRVKGFLLALLLGYPPLALVLKLIGWTGATWWLWGAAIVITFQLLLLLIAPAVIMPLFNKFTPLSEGALPAPFRTGAAHRFSHAQHRGDGRQQTIAPLQCILYRVRTFSKNRPVRHTNRAAQRAGTRIGARA